ncbi:hypothetical protein OROMI_018741 [Orobanche minor]
MSDSCYQPGESLRKGFTACNIPERIWGVTIAIINLIPNLINRIIFSRNTRHLSHTSKEIYSLIRKRKNMTEYWIDNKVESWAVQGKCIDNTEGEFLKDGYSLLIIRQSLSYKLRVGLILLHLPSHVKPFSLRLTLSPSRGILVIGALGIGRSYLVKYLAKNSYLPFVTVFMNKFPYQNSHFDENIEDNYAIGGSDDIDYIDEIADSYDIDCDFVDTELELITKDLMCKELDLFDITFQLPVAKAMSPCIIWIPNIHDLTVNELKYLSFGLFLFERCSTRNIIVIASTHIPHQVDTSILAPNKFNTCIKIRKLIIPQQRKHFFNLSYTRGFHLERKMFHTNGFGSMGYNARELGAFTNLWFLPRTDEKSGSCYFRLLENDSDLLNGLLAVEGALERLSPTEKDCSPFENDRVTLLLRPEPRKPLDMMKTGSRAILDRRFIYKASEFEDWEGAGAHERQHIVADSLNHIVWAPIIWRPWGVQFDWIERPDELVSPYSSWFSSFGGKSDEHEDKVVSPYSSWSSSFEDKSDEDEEDELQESEFLESGDETRYRSLNEQNLF